MGEDPTEQEDEDLPDDETQDASGPDSSPDSDATPDGSGAENDSDSAADGQETGDDGADSAGNGSGDENAAAENWDSRSKPQWQENAEADGDATGGEASDGETEADDDATSDAHADSEDDGERAPDDEVGHEEPTPDDEEPVEQETGSGEESEAGNDDPVDTETDTTEESEHSDEEPEPDDEAEDESETGVKTAHDPDADTAGAARTDGSHATTELPAHKRDDDYAPETPPDDEEMPLTEHIEEMIQRLAVVLFAAAIVTLALFPFASDVIIYMWFDVLPQAEIARPHVYGPLELKLTELKLASIGGLTLALPIGVYQTYLFMRPGLYPHERRYYLAAVPTSLVLAVVGMAFAYFLILPGLFEYFLYYSNGAEEMFVAFGLSDTFGLILTMLGLMAVVFQIPLLIMLAIMMGLTSREWLIENRLYFWGAFLGVAFLFSPDPTGMAPLLVAITMVGLFEGTLQLVKWTGR